MGTYERYQLDRMAREMADTYTGGRINHTCPMHLCGRRMARQPWQIAIENERTVLRAVWECPDGHVDIKDHELT